MNFMSKVSKKPSKQTMLRPKKREHGKPRNNEEEYIEVDLEVEEEERPPVPMFIRGPESHDIVSGDFDDDFFDGAVEDDLELGEEAMIFYDKQKNGSFHHNQGNSIMRQAGGHYPSQPLPGDQYVSHSYGGYHSQSSNVPLDSGYGSGNFIVPSPLIISQGFPQNQISMEPQIAHSPAVGGVYYSSMPGVGTPATPLYGTSAYRHTAPAPTPVAGNFNYLGLSETEMVEFHQLISNGVPEMDAIRTIQYNRIIHPPSQHTPLSRKSSGIPNTLSRTASGIPSSNLSRTTSGIPPVPLPSAADEEDHVYQMILKESIEEEQRRQQRMRVAALQGNDDLTPDEALTIAMQQSYDDYERSKRGDTRHGPNQSYGSPSVGNSNSMSGRSVPKSSGKPPKATSIEKANEDALRQAILLSMQEADSSSSMRPSTASNGGSFYQQSAQYQSESQQSSRAVDSLETRLFSTSTRSGSASSDHYNDYMDGGLIPDYLPQSPFHNNNSSSCEHFLRQPSQTHHAEYYSVRVNPPPTSSSQSSGHFSPAMSGTATTPNNNIYRETNPPPLASSNAAQMILSRRNFPQSSILSSDASRSRSADSQEGTRAQRSLRGSRDIPPDAEYY